MSQRLRLSSLLAAIMLAPGVAAQPSPAALLAGAWSNAAQLADADPALRKPPVAGHPYDWLDHQHALFVPVTIPALAGEALFLTWRAGGPEGPISRQRIWLFRPGPDGGTVMDFYAPKNPDAMAVPAPGATLNLSPDDLIGYGPACALPVTLSASGFAAHIPETCTITARSGRRMALSATIRLDGSSLTYAEAGTLDDGRFAFKVPGGPPYRFQRLD